MTWLSLAMAVPADLRDKANRLACALNHDPMPGNTMSVPLSADGSEPATHYACHTWAQPSFIAILAAAKAGALPPVPWGGFGLTEADVTVVVEALLLSEPAASQVNFDEWAAGHGLVKFV